ncbi:hypothetical protein Cgig2_004687 [Carnegiea gigantea]|uniref:Retrotransposon gag domain-containing protein n=1 Tax=Carnegiea gigantea TaxID=171969 RepID=A0A9Q1GV66_9CARY|nr:hypothetical protein Cgig2_004687 [Carnegiea gigantea]
MRWYNTVDPRKVMNWDDLCKEFLNQYSYNPDLPITLRDPAFLKQEEKEGFTNYLARYREVPAITGNNLRNNHQNKDKKASSSKKVHAVNCITKYTSIGTTYTQALERCMAKGKINLLEIKLIESLMQSKYFDPNKYCKYHRLRAHYTKDCWTFKNRMEKMFKSGQLSLSIVAQNPNNYRNLVGNHENTFGVKDPEKE